MSDGGRVAIIGLGRIGASLVTTLAETRDHELAGYDPVPAAADAARAHAKVAATAREASIGADVVFIAVYDDAQVRAALSGPDGVLAADPPPGAVVILSTVSPETIFWAAEQAEPRDVAILDCGVTGGGKVAAGEIAAMVGGEADAFALARPYLEAFAAPVAHVGPLGAGMRAKLARNLIVFGTRHIVSEAARLALAAGVDLDQLIEVSDAGDRYSGGPTMLLKLGVLPTEPTSDEDRALRENMAGYVHKDVGAALALASELGVELPAAELVLQRCDEELGLG